MLFPVPYLQTNTRPTLPNSQHGKGKGVRLERSKTTVLQPVTNQKISNSERLKYYPNQTLKANAEDKIVCVACACTPIRNDSQTVDRHVNGPQHVQALQKRLCY